MRELLSLIASEPRAPRAPRRGPWDWTLFVAFVAIGLIELGVRPELTWTSPFFLVGLALMPTLLWRRSHPLLVVAVAFGAVAVVDAVCLATGRDFTRLNATGFFLFLSYALFRWGAGREALLGLTIMLLWASVGFVADGASLGDVVGGFAILLSSTALGLAVRNRDRARARELEQAKLREREGLARDLHDTVAHHVSAIAVRAQAGLATSELDPKAAVDALRVIEGEASRALADMRGMVGYLRRDEPAELAPTPTVADLERLASASSQGPELEVEIAGDVDDLSPSVSAAVYRLAQESVTNARRHARNATRIRVDVHAGARSVRLRVSDDGELAERSRGGKGYGLAGMTERATLLGGTCHAGPDPERGWTVTAELPRNGATT